jgi:hypothetical protein
VDAVRIYHSAAPQQKASLFRFLTDASCPLRHGHGHADISQRDADALFDHDGVGVEAITYLEEFARLGTKLGSITELQQAITQAHTIRVTRTKSEINLLLTYLTGKSSLTRKLDCLIDENRICVHPIGPSCRLFRDGTIITDTDCLSMLRICHNAACVLQHLLILSSNGRKYTSVHELLPSFTHVHKVLYLNFI